MKLHLKDLLKWYLPERMMFKKLGAIFFLAFALLSCIPSGNITKVRNPESNKVGDSFKLDIQKAPPNEFQSIQLFRKGSENNPPIISLNSRDKLILKFDELSNSSKQFKVVITHRSKDWTPSTLSSNFYLNSFNEFYFSGGLKSFSQRPGYFHYNYEFPNSQLSFNVSGNYLLELYDYNSNNLLFSLPFFVSENKGDLSTRITTLFAQGNNLRPRHQLFSSYTYPDFVSLPQFDLSYYYVQNQFWGNRRNIEIFDTATPGEVNFHLGRDHSFIGNFEFNTINLNSLNSDGKQILEVQRGTIPPKVILRRDVEKLDPVPAFFPDSRFGLPVDDRSASYAEVKFRLEPDKRIPANAQIYLVGDFNQWILSERHRLSYNAQNDLWEGSALIKQGEYAYKYVTVSGGAVDTFSLDQGFSMTRQNYLSFVYFKDPKRNYDRLLKVIETRSN